MESKHSIIELVSLVLNELRRLNYTHNTFIKYQAFYNKFCAYAEVNGEEYFSEELGMKYLEEKHSCTVNYYQEAFPKGTKEVIRMIRVLGDYQIHGILIRRIVKKPNYVKPIQFEKILTAYEKECQANDYSERGMRTRLQRLFFFIDYLDLCKIQDIGEVTPNLISDYVRTIFPHHEKSIASILTTLRVFLKFLYLNEYTRTDLSLSVPKQSKYYYPAIPSTWNENEVKRMLESIDRGNPLGKRDYAILLLVAKLGMRVGDLKALRLSSFNWDSKMITITQEKTKNVSCYPILDDIGWAVIDYLKNARPDSESSYLFLRMIAPFEPFGKNANLHNIITKYTRKAGIKVPHGKKHGLHSLRHSLASGLLAQGTPLPIISEILGHIDSKSTSLYLRTDIEGLKCCALNPEDVFIHA